MGRNPSNRLPRATLGICSQVPVWRISSPLEESVAPASSDRPQDLEAVPGMAIQVIFQRFH